MKKTVFGAAGVLCALLLCAGLWSEAGRAHQARVEARFAADLPQLTRTAQGLLAGEAAEPPAGWTGADVYGEAVCFDAGGWGFGSSTSYRGVVYVPSDRPVGFQGLDMAGAIPSGDGWLWEEAEGDNRCYVERLAPGWYYYEMRF